MKLCEKVYIRTCSRKLEKKVINEKQESGFFPVQSNLVLTAFPYIHCGWSLQSLKKINEKKSNHRLKIKFRQLTNFKRTAFPLIMSPLLSPVFLTVFAKGEEQGALFPTV